MSSSKKKEYALILRTCDAQMQSHEGFIWPKSGKVSAPDWKPTKVCGNGLHGFLNGEGDGSLANWNHDDVWLVARVEKSTIIHLDGKVKFPSAKVLLAGTREEATGYLREHGCMGAIVGGTAIAGDKGKATAGYKGMAIAGDNGKATTGYGGTAIAGDKGTATAGNGGTATAGDWGTATAGNGGTAIAGVKGTATAGDKGTAIAGYGGTATAGYGGTATAGYRGTAIAGYGGTAIAGYRGTATAGYGGTATAGDKGIINIHWWDGKRYRVATFYVGEDDIQPNTPYRTEAGKAVKAGVKA